MRISNKLLHQKHKRPILSWLAFPILFVLLVSLSCASKESIRKPVYKRDASGAAISSTGKRYHVVKRGDTLYSIARKYGTTISQIRKLNKIRDDRDIKTGTKLFLPGKKHGKKVSRPKRRPKTPTYAPRSSVKFVWPVKRIKVSSRFGIRSNKKHDGIDLRGKKGAPIYAAARGKVLFSGRGPSGYGNMIIIKHNKSTISIYAHNYRNIVREGQFVKQRQKIATIGRSGRATGYHVHFEIRINRRPVNPENYLR